MTANKNTEVAKLECQLTLLREEYVKLQSRLTDSERNYEILVAQCASESLPENSFVYKLISIVRQLFESETSSDITIRLDGHDFPAHRFVLAARSDEWSFSKLDGLTFIDFEDVQYNIGHTILKWVYSNEIDCKLGDGFMLDVMKTAHRFKLSLVEKCEQILIARLDRTNCLRFYKESDEIGANALKAHASEFITRFWEEFTSDDFEAMSAPLMYKFLKAQVDLPLHNAIRLKREDVVFLFLTEYHSQLSTKINERDNDDLCPLALALHTKQTHLAETIVRHGADVNCCDSKGRTVLIKFLLTGDLYACRFLLDNGASLNCTDPLIQRTPLHLASFIKDDGSSNFADNFMVLLRTLLRNTADVNCRDKDLNTPLHLSIMNSNELLFNTLLEQRGLDIEATNRDGYRPFWYALACGVGRFQIARKLLSNNADICFIHPSTGNTYLHNALQQKLLDAAKFLISMGVPLNTQNAEGQTAILKASQLGFNEVVQLLLINDADANIVSPSDGSSPLHVAVVARNRELVHTLLHVEGALKTHTLNMNIQNNKEETPLELALMMGSYDIANELADSGADVNAQDSAGNSLLLRCMMKANTEACLQLIEFGASVNVRNAKGMSALLFAVNKGYTSVVSALCDAGAMTTVRSDDSGEDMSILWTALQAGYSDVATVLVQNGGCDVDFWCAGPSGCFQTLLHKALDENNETAACFLIRNNCNVHALRKLGPKGEGREDVEEKDTPLHMAAAWGLRNVVMELLAHGADVNAQDKGGRTPLHIAVENQHQEICELLLDTPNVNLYIRSRGGLTPLHLALKLKNNKIAETIVKKDRNICLQVDNKGYNPLHNAAANGDIETILMLLALQTDVRVATEDEEKQSALHLAVRGGDEMIVRTLILAGADVNAVNGRKQSVLHVAALNDRPQICSILLEKGANCKAVDSYMHNALHLAVQTGNLACVKVLLEESSVDALAINLKGHNPLHLLGIYGKENAAAIFQCLIANVPNYPLDTLDPEGNTAFLLAYMKGNFQLCRVIMKAGACISIANSHGVSVFNHPVPTQHLLMRLLDELAKEPPWEDADVCSECGIKFGFILRKHHCRHCGRLLCGKCSENSVLIMKYGAKKPLRVCNICCSVLTFGVPT